MKNEKKPPVSRNDDVLLTIDALTSEGQGVGRIDGYTVFVVGALPQEKVTAHIIKVTPSYAIAKVQSLIEPSPDRVSPRCAVYGPCGGCQMQHMTYESQLRAKRQAVVDALTRLCGFVAPPVREIVGMDEPWHYRNKGSFPFAPIGGAAAYGFFAERSHRLVPFTDCPIQDERVLDAVSRVAAWANENHVAAYDETTKRGCLRAVVARTSVEGETMAVVVTRGPLVKQKELLFALDNVDSVYHSRNDKETNVLFGETFTLLCGKAVITETIGNLRFRVGPQSFLQINPVQTRALYGAAIELLSPKADETILDAYCGVGTISLLLSKSCKRVIGVEQVPSAIEDARQNAAANGVENATFLCGNTEDVLPRLLTEGQTFDALVLDPPRKGCEEKALSAIAESGVSRVAYVSCNPATLARDCKYLAAHGFVLTAVQPVDMFPQTCHVETVVLMSRVNK